jgi:acetyl esterase/lipase
LKNTEIAMILTSQNFQQTSDNDRYERHVPGTVLPAIDQMYIVLGIHVSFHALNKSNEKWNARQEDSTDPIILQIAGGAWIVPALGVHTPNIIKVTQRIGHGTELVPHPEIRKL